MQKLFDASVIKTLKDGIKKGWWTLEDLDTPPPGWVECINNCKGNPAFPQGYEGVKYQNLARVKNPNQNPNQKKRKYNLLIPKTFQFTISNENYRTTKTTSYRQR